jgi:hypothetical protein
MATKRPSFLKRQKEQKRTARAIEKREARKERKQARSTEQEFSVPPDHPVEEFETSQHTKP